MCNHLRTVAFSVCGVCLERLLEFRGLALIERADVEDLAQVDLHQEKKESRDHPGGNPGAN